MRKRFTVFQIIYIVIALVLLTSFGVSQARGFRYFNLFDGSLNSHSGPDRSGPDHK